MSARRYLVDGVVQGVFYRDGCARAAVRCRVTGWVRNLVDGRVEVWAEGAPEALDCLLAWCRTGSSRSRVARVQVVPCEPEGHASFRVVATA